MYKYVYLVMVSGCVDDTIIAACLDRDKALAHIEDLDKRVDFKISPYYIRPVPLVGED